MLRSARASPTSSSICISRGWRCGRSATSVVRSTSTRCSSPKQWCPTISGWARWAKAGRSRTRRFPASGRWCRVRARAASIASAASASIICSSWRARSGRNRDPVVRQALMRVLSEERIRDWTNQRVRAQAKAGRSPGPESSIGKVHQGGLNQRMQLLATELLGADAIAWSGDGAAARSARDAAEPGQHDRGRHHRDQQERRGRARPRPAPRARPLAQRVVAGDAPLIGNRSVRTERNRLGRRERAVR